MAVESKVTSVEFTKPDEGFYFQRLTTLCSKRRDFTSWHFKYASDQLSNRDYDNVMPLSRRQATDLINHATFSYLRMLNSMGNESATLLVEESRIEQGLPPMERK